jgi:hypothetical protein
MRDASNSCLACERLGKLTLTLKMFFPTTLFFTIWSHFFSQCCTNVCQHYLLYTQWWAKAMNSSLYFRALIFLTANKGFIVIGIVISTEHSFFSQVCEIKNRIATRYIVLFTQEMCMYYGKKIRQLQYELVW